MSFPRYPKYKASGVEWLGEVPEHWKVIRLGTLEKSGSDFVSGPFGSSLGSSDYVESGIPVIRGLNTTLNAEARFVAEGFVFVDESKFSELERCDAKPGDLVFTARGTVGKVGIVPDTIPQSLISPNQLRYRPDSELLVADYLFYLFASSGLFSEISLIADSVAQPNLNLGSLKSLRVPLPPRDQQTQITAFLDRETAKIDGLVAEQQRLIELLKEKRQAVISHAITKGLNPDAPLKPSGIEWLGDVPEHWTVASVRRIVRRIEQGWSPSCLGRPAEPDEWGVVKSGCVNRGVYAEAENKALPEDLEPIPEYEITPGDVLVSRASGSPELVGSTAYITTTRPKLMLSDKTFRIHTEPSIDRQYFVAIFNSHVMRSQIECAISGAEGLANNLPQSAMKDFFCVIPPLNEQVAIVSFLAREIAAFDALAAEAQHAIDLLQERRTALISAATTGQIDVRPRNERQTV